MANPSLSLLKQNLLKGLPITATDLAYVVENLADIISGDSSLSYIKTSGNTTLSSTTSVTATKTFTKSAAIQSVNLEINGDSATNPEFKVRIETGFGVVNGTKGLTINDNGSDIFAYDDSGSLKIIQATPTFAKMQILTGANQTSIVLSNAIYITDSINTAGMGYAGDYSVNGLVTFGSRWIIDKGYFDSKRLTATATLDFPSTATNLSSDLTVTVTGAALGDVVAVGPPHGSTFADSCYTAWVSSSNTVTVRFNNYGATTRDPASGTFRVMVFKP